jgi:hypothetical protein
MQISELAWRLILLFTPGILCTALVDTLVVHKPWKPFDFLVRAFILGVMCYFALQLFLIAIAFLYTLFFKEFVSARYLGIWDSITEQTTPIPLDEVIYSSITSIFVGFLASKVINDKLLFKLAHKTHTSKKFGDDSLWSYFLNSDVVEWVWIRFAESDIVYSGWVQSFSDTEKVREIVLEDVKVYLNSANDLLYELPAVYLSGEPSKMIIELTPVVENEPSVSTPDIITEQKTIQGDNFHGKKADQRRLRQENHQA